MKSNEMYTYGMIAVDNALWMINCKYNYIFMYDIVSEKIKKIFEIPIGGTYSRFCIEHIFSNDNKLFLISNTKKRAVSFDLHEEMFSKIDMELSVFYEFVSVSNIDNMLYGVNEKDNVLYKVNLNDGVCSEEKIGEQSNRYQQVKVFSDGTIILLDYIHKQILVKADDILRKLQFPVGVETRYENLSYNNFAVVGDCAYLFPKYANMVLEIDLSNYSISVIGEKFIDESYYSEGQIYTCVEVYEEKIYAFANYEYSIHIYDAKGNLIGKKKVELKQEQMDIISKESIISKKQDNYYYEDKYLCTLRRYVSDLIKYDKG